MFWGAKGFVVTQSTNYSTGCATLEAPGLAVFI
uniref:Uncharacterized protein n=1 Tax=Anguilla anguilla TaxID=7936 RepID=A0A0E9SGD6_ANGAN